MTDLPNLRDLILRDGDIDLDDVGGGSPSTLSRLRNGPGPNITGIASGAPAAIHWTAPEITGTDIAVDGGDDTFVAILADGLYAVLFQAEIAAEGGGEHITGVGSTYLGDLTSANAGGVFEDGVSFVDRIVDFPIVPTFYAAGSSLKVAVTATTSSGTWLCYPGIIVQRLA